MIDFPSHFDGSNDAAVTRKARRKALRRIELTLRIAEGAMSQPPFHKAVLVFAVLLAALVGAAYIANMYGFALDNVRARWLVIVGAVVPAAVVYLISPVRTWSDQLYTLLADYDPADRDAFKRFQDSSKAEGLSSHGIRSWLADEWNALQELKQPGPDAPSQRFYKQSR